MRRRDLGLALLSAPLLTKAAKAIELYAPFTQGPTASFPSGAIIEWFADQYSAANNAIPNNIQSGLHPNLFRGSRRLFNNTNFWNISSTTVVDNAVVGPDGATEASTSNGTGNWFIGPNNATTNQTSGQYTVAVNAKRNTGSDQQFCFTKDNTATRSSVMTATSSWQRFTYTFTGSVSQPFSHVLLCSIDGATAANIQICDFEIYAGSSDLGPIAPKGDLYFGYSGPTSAPTVSGNVVDCSSGGVAFAQLATSAAFSNQAFTMMALVSKTNSSSTYEAFASPIQSYTSGTAYLDIQDTARDPFTTVYAEVNGVGLWSLLSTGWHVLTHTFDGATSNMYLDDIPLFSHAATIGAFTITDLGLNWVNAIAPSAFKWQNVVIWARALSLNEVRSAAGILRARGNNQASLGATPWLRTLLCEGDSITGGFTYCYPYQASYSPTILGNDVGHSGNALSDLNGRAAADDARLPPTNARSGRKFIFSVLIGANDLKLYSGGANQYAIDLAAYCDARRTAGWKVVVCTVLPQNDATFNGRRATLNAEIKLWTTNGSIVPGVHADAIADFASDPNYGLDADAADASKYPDGLHPVSAGQLAFAGLYQTAVNSI